MIDWKLVSLVVLVACMSLACMTVLAVKGLVAGAIVTTFAGSAFTGILGWVSRPPLKPKEQSDDVRP